MNDLALTCSGLTDLVTDYLDNALDPHRALSFEMHAVFCPGCRVFVTQMRETVERLSVAASRSPRASARTEFRPSGAARDRVQVPSRRAPRAVQRHRVAALDREVEGDRPPDPCRNGVHACRVGDLDTGSTTSFLEVELGGESSRSA